MAHRVVVRTAVDGKTEVSIDGMPGVSCKDATKALERALGVTSSDKPTVEMHQPAKAAQNIQQGA